MYITSWKIKRATSWDTHVKSWTKESNKEIAYIKWVEDTLRQLWTYFENSPKRLAVLLKMQINIKKCSLQLREKSKQILVTRMKTACSTRWLSFDKSVAALYQEYKAVLHTLQVLDEGGCATAEKGKICWSALHFERCPASPVQSVKGISRWISGLLSNCSPD